MYHFDSYNVLLATNIPVLLMTGDDSGFKIQIMRLTEVNCVVT